MKLACQNCRLEVIGMQEYGIHKVHMRMLPDKTGVKERLEADYRQVQFLNLGLGLKRV
jgi:hypothetical protein